MQFPYWESEQDKHACYECAKSLIEQAPLSILNARDDEGETLLMKAIKIQQIDIALALISKNVDVYIQDKKGRTALHWAAGKELDEIYNILARFEKINDITDTKTRTALEYLLENKIMPYLISTKMWPYEFHLHFSGSVDTQSGYEGNQDQQEFIQLYQNFVKQLFEIHENYVNIQGTNDDCYFSEFDNKIIADIINIIKTIDSFAKIVQIDAIMMKIEQVVRDYIQQVKIFRINHGDTELLTQNLLYRLIAKIDELQNEIATNCK